MVEGHAVEAVAPQQHHPDEGRRGTVLLQPGLLLRGQTLQLEGGGGQDGPRVGKAVSYPPLKVVGSNPQCLRSDALKAFSNLSLCDITIWGRPFG